MLVYILIQMCLIVYHTNRLHSWSVGTVDFCSFMYAFFIIVQALLLLLIVIVLHVCVSLQTFYIEILKSIYGRKTIPGPFVYKFYID